MSREAPRWNPPHWTQEHARRSRNHAINTAIEALRDILGLDNGALVSATFLRDMYEQESKDKLKAMGILTLSDVTDLGPSPKKE